MLIDRKGRLFENFEPKGTVVMNSIKQSNKRNIRGEDMILGFKTFIDSRVSSRSREDMYEKNSLE